MDFRHWETVGPEKLHRGDTVRVVLNAFRGRVGEMHNGRVGVVIDKADGNIIVASTDNRKPTLKHTRYPFYLLEKEH